MEDRDIQLPSNLQVALGKAIDQMNLNVIDPLIEQVIRLVLIYRAIFGQQTSISEGIYNS